MADTPSASVPSRIQAARPFIAGAVLAVLLVSAAVLGIGRSRPASAHVVIGDSLRVRVTVADDPAERERGLSGHPGLAADEGMFFVFERPDRHAFWMKDMRFAIDILWVKDGAIVDITSGAEPSASGEELPLFFPRVPVDRVLEVPSGFAQAHGLRIGMPVRLEGR